MINDSRPHAGGSSSISRAKVRRMNPRRKAAFTLAEVLVALAIVAGVAAIVLPTIMSQLSRSDPARVAGDASNIKSAVEQFINDVGQYPKRVTHLTRSLATNPLASPRDSGAIYGPYSVSEGQRWKGPYLTRTGSSVLATGYNLAFDSLLYVDTLGTSGLSEVVATNPRFLTLCLAIDSSSALAIDTQFDDGNLQTGLFRWTVNTITSDTLKYLVVPIQ
jgi:prepilin-type N-terminal cleavage/methylation domain-containing protein